MLITIFAILGLLVFCGWRCWALCLIIYTLIFIL